MLRETLVCCCQAVTNRLDMHDLGATPLGTGPRPNETQFVLLAQQHSMPTTCSNRRRSSTKYSEYQDTGLTLSAMLSGDSHTMFSTRYNNDNKNNYLANRLPRDSALLPLSSVVTSLSSLQCKSAAILSPPASAFRQHETTPLLRLHTTV